MDVKYWMARMARNMLQHWFQKRKCILSGLNDVVWIMGRMKSKE